MSDMGLKVISMTKEEAPSCQQGRLGLETELWHSMN